MPGIEDLFASSAPQSQPVQNATTQGNAMQAQNVMNQARQAQTALQVQDVAMKQRQMQLSVLNGVLALPPQQQGDALSRVVPMMNRLGPTQFDEGMTPETAKMFVMSQVPAQNIPEFALNQQMVPMMQAVQQRIAGGAPGQGGTPMPTGMPMPQNGQIQPQGSAPIPQGGGQPIDPQSLEMMAAIPKLAPMAKDMSDIQNQSPQGQAAIEGAKNSAKNTSEAQKGALEAGEGYNQVKQSIDSLKSLINDPNLPQSKYGIPAKGQAWESQNFGDQKAADTYNTFQTINESQTINAIRSLADTGQIKMTKTLEGIINRGFLVDPDASQTAKMQQANAVDNELANSAAAAQNVASKMTGGQATAPYKAPYTGKGTPMPQSHPLDGATATGANGQKLILKGGQWMPQ